MPETHVDQTVARPRFRIELGSNIQKKLYQYLEGRFPASWDETKKSIELGVGAVETTFRNLQLEQSYTDLFKNMKIITGEERALVASMIANEGLTRAVHENPHLNADSVEVEIGLFKNIREAIAKAEASVLTPSAFKMHGTSPERILLLRAIVSRMMSQGDEIREEQMTHEGIRYTLDVARVRQIDKGLTPQFRDKSAKVRARLKTGFK